MYLKAALILFLVFKIEETYGDDEFSSLFYDNKDILFDKPIVFENPLPKWLRGSLVRTGPGLFGNGPRKYTHAFDGFGKMYNWKFYGNGSASFSTNFLHSSVYNNSIRINNIDNYFTFMKTIPPFPLAEAEMGIIKGMDNTNVNVYSFYNSKTKEYEYSTLADAWKIYQINPVTLETIGPVNADKPAGTGGFISIMSSAHPVPEHGSGHHFTFLTSVSVIPGVKSRLSVVRVKSTHERELVAQWEVDKAPYMHSFSVTPNYVILFAPPYYANPLMLLKNADAFSGINWIPSEKSHFYVVNIKTGKVISLESEAVNPTHHANAYEEDNKIIMDICTSKDPFFALAFKIDTMRNASKRNVADYVSEIIRYTIDLDTTKMYKSKFQTNASVPFMNYFDIPTINELFRHQKYCYIYGVGFKMDFKTFSKTALIKKDVCGNNEDKFWAVDGHFPVEMWFVPTPNSTREDDGILLTPVLSGDKQQSYLMILNATTMTVMNRGYLPSRVPFTIHGRFFPDVL